MCRGEEEIGGGRLTARLGASTRMGAAAQHAGHPRTLLAVVATFSSVISSRRDQSKRCLMSAQIGTLTPYRASTVGTSAHAPLMNRTMVRQWVMCEVRSYGDSLRNTYV